MGVIGLKSYLNRYFNSCFKPTKLHNSKLVIDGSIFSTGVYNQGTDHERARYGAEYHNFATIVINFLQQLKSRNIEAIIVIDGLRCMPKEVLIRSFENYVITMEKDEIPALAPLLLNVYIEIIREMGVKLIMAIGGADDTIGLLAKKNNCPVLSTDGNFYFYGVNILTDHEFIKTDWRTPWAPRECILKDKMFYSSALKEKLNLDESLLPLILLLLGHTNRHSHLNSEVMKPFMIRLNRAFRSDCDRPVQKQIDKTLQWATHYTKVNDAIADLLACINKEHRKKLLHTIHANIQRFCKPSRAVLEYLGFDRARISTVIAQHNEKFEEFEGNLDDLEIPEFLNVENDVEDYDNEAVEQPLQDPPRESTETEKYEQFSEEELFATVPYRMIDDHTKGKNRGIFIELRMYKAVFLYPQCEYTMWEEYGEICLPILSAIFSIVSSSTAEEDTLQVYSNRRTEIVMREISVPKSAIQLDDIDRLGLDERRSILNQALKLRPDEDLKEIPDRWKLYIASVVFWMKSDIPCKKDITYLRVVIAAILNGVVTMEKAPRPMPPNTSLTEDMERCTLRDEQSLQQLIDSITDDERSAAARAFFNQPLYAKGTKNLNATVINTFGQIDVCLKYIIEFNGLLGFPYDNMVIHKLIDGILFYNLFNIFQQQENFYEFLSDRLKNAPNVLRSFLVLEKIALQLIDG